MNRILKRFQFGDTYQRRAPGYVLVGGIYCSPAYLWSTPPGKAPLLNAVHGDANLDVDDPLLEGFVFLDDAADFLVGLPDGAYQVTMTCYDRANDRGPFAVKSNGRERLARCAPAANELVVETFACEAVDGILRLEFVPEPGADFLVNGLVLEGPARVALHPIFKSAPPVAFPGRQEMAAVSENDPAEALASLCDWLLDRQRLTGPFLGEPDGGWYTAAFATRALLAACDVLGRKPYLDGAVACLDLLVSEQMPTGAFLDGYRGIPTAERSASEVERMCRTERQPMSDIGSMVAALAIASTYVQGPHRETYRHAVQLFCDNWAPKFQHPSGAFSDGPTLSPLGEIYTCATTIEAAVFSLAHAVTGNARYDKVAGDAIRFLLPDWFRDGRMIGRSPHWCVRNRLPFVLEPLYFGDHYYFDEGFITTAYHTRDEGLRDRINEAMRWRVFGQCGLLASLRGRAWWPVEGLTTWGRAKSAGMPQSLLYARRCGCGGAELDDALSCMEKFLCTHAYARRLGVAVEDDERPADVHGHQTWSGMRMEATGFAAMTLAEMIKPGVLYLAASRQP